ncbi:hypothetical protein [Corynebacterium amycolatum]|uniref:hypothetical protein n=1 Tax=Corynebacterium amycolatum TaxID=43765 RepID=UPI001CCE4CC9|nr:hypothetical protein [Corynebacterium amycolatum]MCA0444277.1 hypothetical protein [Corynebacterium amycolatum]
MSSRTRAAKPVRRSRFVTETPHAASNLKLCLDIVDASGCADKVHAWRVKDGLATTKGGCPTIVSTQSALALWLLTSLTGDPQLVSVMARSMVHRMNNKTWRLLELEPEKVDLTNPALVLAAEKRWYWRLWEAIERIRQAIEPYPEVSRLKRYTGEQWLEVASVFDPARASKARLAFGAKRMRRGTELANALLWASLKVLAPESLEKWNGDIVLDGTVIEVSKNGNPSIKRLKGGVIARTLMSSTPTAGWHSKAAEDHAGSGYKQGDTVFGFEATIAAMVNPTDSGAPNFVVGLGFHRPGVQPHARVFEALRNVVIHDAPRGDFLGDRLYAPGQKADKLQVPLRKMGYRIIADQKSTETGQQTVLENGAVLVDGKYHCPAILNRKGLIDPAGDLAAGRISEETFDRRIEHRQLLQLVPKGKPNENGDQRLMCPAKARGGGLSCPLVPLGQEGKSAKTREPLLPTEAPKRSECPAVCRQSSVTARNHAHDGAKYAQQGPAWKTREWKKSYGRRSTIEGINAQLKTARGVGHGDPPSRLMRGWAAQLVSVAVSLVVTNARLASNAVFMPFKSPEPTPPSTPPTKGRKASDRMGTDSPNAPPMAA